MTTSSTKFVCGWLPNPSDDRDSRYAARNVVFTPNALSAAHPFQVEERFEFLLGANYQDGLGSCVPQHGMNAVRYHVLADAYGLERSADQVLLDEVPDLDFRTELAPRFSRLASYYLARSQHDDIPSDSGTYPRTFWKALREYGFADEELWPYVEDLFAAPPPPAYWSRAADMTRALGGEDAFRYFIFEDYAEDKVDQIIRTLRAGWPVNIGFHLRQSFMDVRSSDLFLKPDIRRIDPWDYTSKESDPFVGRHFLTLTSWHPDREAFGFMNSWEGWGFGLDQPAVLGPRAHGNRYGLVGAKTVANGAVARDATVVLNVRRPLVTLTP